MKVLAFTLFLALAMSANAAHWAVLVAGSNGFWNYRHQADICHAYQILLKNGYSADHIVTLAYDDVANSSQNPFKGQLFNRPNGNDVYAGCQIDYRGADVTPATFLAVLKGDSAAVQGRKVLQTTAEDKIFINFSDHGATGLIAFPSTYLYAKDLLAAFEYMHSNNKYQKLVFYLETCESGSMFQNLPTNWNIYALSAASPDESSWGYYCPPDDSVNGKHVGSCLGDHFSINWMEDTDKGRLDETLQEQFEVIRTLTTKSKVMQWGDVSWTNEPISEYVASRNTYSFLKSYRREDQSQNVEMWNSRNNKLLYLINQFKQSHSASDFIALQQEFKSRQFYDQKFQALKQNMNLTGSYYGNENKSCLEQQVDNFETYCGKLTDYSLKYVSYLSEMCDNSNMLGAHMVEHIKLVCDN